MVWVGRDLEDHLVQSLGCGRYYVSKIFNKLELGSKLYSTHFPLSYGLLPLREQDVSLTVLLLN